MSFAPIIPFKERHAVEARRFAAYVAPQLTPPEPPPDAAAAFPPSDAAAEGAPAMPGGSPPPAAPPAPPPQPDVGSPAGQAAAFAAYVAPRLSDNTPPAMQEPQQPSFGGQAPPAPPMPSGGAPGADSPQFGAAGEQSSVGPDAGSPAEQAAAFASYVAPQLNAFNRLAGPPASAAAVPDPVRGPFAADPLGRAAGAGGDILASRVAEGDRQRQAFEDAAAAYEQSLGRGQRPTAEQIAPLFHAAEPFTMAMSGEPLHVVGRTARALAGAGAAGDTVGQAGMSLGPVSPHEPEPGDFAAWMQFRKDQAAGQPTGPTSRQPMGMRADEQHAREQFAAENPLGAPPREPGPAAPPLAGPATQAGMPMAGDEAIARTDRMYAEGPTRAQQPLVERWHNLGTSFTRAWTDAGADLSNLEKQAASQLGRPLNAGEMASVQSRMNPFYTARIRVDEGIRPAIADLSDRDYADVRNILTWKGNVDVAAAKGNQARAFSGDLSAADSAAALGELSRRLGPERYADLERRAASVTDFNVDELARDVKAGLVSDAQAAEWMQKYPSYTPVVIQDYLKEQGRAIGGGKSLNVQGTGYKTLSEAGTVRGRLDPIAASIDAAYRGEALRRQNISWRALHDLIQETPAFQDLFQVARGGYTGATKYENSVSGFIDGERWTITTPFPDVAKAIRQEAGGVSIPGWNTAMALYKELITARNPTFLVGNAAIDAPLAILNTAMREGGAQHVLPVAVDLFTGYADAFRGVLSGQYLGQSTSGFLKGGGGMGFYAAPSATSGAQEVARLRRSTVFDVSSAGDAVRLAKDLVALNWVKGLGERVELGPRAMAYQRALNRGLGADQAVLQGRTVTVDFAQGGTLSKLINSFVPFFNPAVQGVATTARIVKEHPGGALLTLGPALVGPTLAAEAWNRADPARSRAYDDVPTYVKDRGVVVMLPGAPPTDATGETRPQFVTINLRQLAPVAILTREVYDRVVGRDGRTAGDLLQGAGQQLSPISGFASILPPIGGTALELAINKDVYRTAPIATTRTDQRASALGQAVAGGVNAAAASRGVYADVRPSQVDYALRNTAGAAGELATSGSNVLTGRPDRGTPQDVPVAGGFLRRFVRGDTGQLLQDARADRLSDPVRIALADAGVRYDPAPARGDLGGIVLHRDEQTLFQETLNRHADANVQKLIASASWQRLDATRKADQVRQQVDAARARAASEVLRSIGSAELSRRRQEAAAARASATPRPQQLQQPVARPQDRSQT